MRIPPRMFPQVVSISTSADPIGYDDYGQPYYGILGYDDYGNPILDYEGQGGTVEFPARIDQTVRTVRGDNGTEVTARATIWIPGNADVDGVPVMMTPEGERPIISVRKIIGSRDVEYTEVYVS